MSAKNTPPPGRVPAAETRRPVVQRSITLRVDLRVLAALGGALIIIGALLPWITPLFQPFVRVLNPVTDGGLPVIIIGILIITLLFMPRFVMPRVSITAATFGFAAGLLALWSALNTLSLSRTLVGDQNLSPLSDVGLGVYLTLAGSIIAVLAGLAPQPPNHEPARAEIRLWQPATAILAALAVLGVLGAAMAGFWLGNGGSTGPAGTPTPAALNANVLDTPLINVEVNPLASVTPEGGALVAPTLPPEATATPLIPIESTSTLEPSPTRELVPTREPPTPTTSPFTSPPPTATPTTVNKADTTTTIASDSPDPSVVGQTVAVSYTVAVNAPGSGTPTGNVTVTDGVNNCVGSVASGTCNMSFTSPGSKSLAATYAGDVNYNGSTSASVSHQVNKADTTTTILSDLPDPSNIGQSVVVTYSVSVNDPGSGTPTGNVTVSDGTDSCNATVAAPSCTINFSIVGTKTLTATYAGDSKFNGSTSAGVSHQVNQASTTTTIISSHNPSLFGQSVTFTATVTSTVGIPTGSITFRDGATPIMTVTLSGGIAAFNTASLTVGAHPITASYPGDVNHLGSTNTLTQTVQDVPIANLSANSSSPTVLGTPTFFTATLSAGSNVTYTWDFGDNSPIGNNQTTSHNYGTQGHYQVVVTATNSVSVVTATTSVLVLKPRVFLPLVIRSSAAEAFVTLIFTTDLTLLAPDWRAIRRP